LLGVYAARHIDPEAVVIAAAAGIRFGGKEFAFLDLHRVNNPTTGVPAMAEQGFAIAIMATARIAGGSTSSELDALCERRWFLDEYLNAPGLIRKGKKLSRREVIKHMANEMGGVHVQKSESSLRELLSEAEDKVLIDDATQGEIRTHYIEVFAIGQAVGRSKDLQKLADKIRS
jgi:hypothetical protein